jgi:hypothetical protein
MEISWRDSNYIPPLEDHLKVTLITCFYWAINCTAFVVFEENVTVDVLKWMLEFPQIVKDSCIISRLMDDIVAHAVMFSCETHKSIFFFYTCCNINLFAE